MSVGLKNISIFVYKCICVYHRIYLQVVKYADVRDSSLF